MRYTFKDLCQIRGRHLLLLLTIIALNESTAFAQISSQQLEKLPQTKQVVELGAENPQHQVIHLLNYHFLSRELFAADLEDRRHKRLAREEINEKYEEFLQRIESVQKEQIAVLRELIRHHGVKEVYYEGVTNKNQKQFLLKVERVKNFQPPYLDSASPFDLLIREQYAHDLLEIGAPGKLLISRELQAVRPLDAAEPLEAANPIREDGRFVFDEHANETREDFMVRHLLSETSLVVIVLGAGHDLTNNLAKQTSKFRYIKISTKHLPNSPESLDAR